jgi:uncharacterized LabA/DUF88 family protein
MSVIKHKNQRVGVFIDAQNLYHSAKNLHHGRVNFGEVLADALGERQLVRAIAYVITTESGEESSFFEALNKVGIETKTKDLQIFSSGSKKADWDVGLAIDAVKLASKLDVVVLASGDGDFVPLVEYLKMNGCQVEVITFGKSASGKLREVADDFIDLDLDPARYVMGHGAGGRGYDKRRGAEPSTKAPQVGTRQQGAPSQAPAPRITSAPTVPGSMLPERPQNERAPRPQQQNKITKIIRKMR